MPLTFTHSFDFWFRRAMVGAFAAAILALVGLYYYGPQQYTRVGYAPVQPVPFSHAQHAGQLGLSCLYCHTGVEESSVAKIPSTQTCMNCHQTIKADSPKIALVKASFETGKPIPWIRVHKTPDYVFFNHSAHVKRGVGCVSCHGQVNEMPVVVHDKSLSMGWCLDCHRQPENQLRPVTEATNLAWRPAEGRTQHDLGLYSEGRVQGSRPGTVCRVPPMNQEIRLQHRNRLHWPTGKAYWRSLDQLADTPEFRDWVERRFPAVDEGAAVRRGRSAAFPAVDGRLARSGRAGGMSPARDQGPPVLEASRRGGPGTPELLRHGHPSPRLQPSRFWSRATRDDRPRSRATPDSPTAGAPPTRSPRPRSWSSTTRIAPARCSRRVSRPPGRTMTPLPPSTTPRFASGRERAANPREDLSSPSLDLLREHCRAVLPEAGWHVFELGFAGPPRTTGPTLAFGSPVVPSLPVRPGAGHPLAG